MIKSYQTLLLVLISTLFSSCAYCRARINDGKDMVTLCGGLGLGGMGQVGPVKTGLGMSFDQVGMSDGYIGMANCGHFNGAYQASFVVASVQDSWKYNDGVSERGKGYEAGGFLYMDPKYKVSTGWLKPYFTQLEIDGKCYVGIRAGVNIGEVIDFVLGFVGIDIYGDDVDINIARVQGPSATSGSLH